MKEQEKYLKRIVELLEEMNKRPITPMYFPPVQQLPPNPNIHYHGAMPCFNNPCVWC